jgi:hypothetical protein
MPEIKAKILVLFKAFLLIKAEIKASFKDFLCRYYY